MNFWVKHRFWIAGLLFIIPSVGALAMLYFKCISDADLLYPFSLAIIGLAFTFAQFYFQINENRFQRLEEKRSSALKLLMNVTTKMENLLYSSIHYYSDFDLLSREYKDLHVELCGLLDVFIQAVLEKEGLLNDLKKSSDDILNVIFNSNFKHNEVVDQRIQTDEPLPDGFMTKLRKVQSKEWIDNVNPLLTEFINIKKKVVENLNK